MGLCTYTKSTITPHYKITSKEAGDKATFLQISSKYIINMVLITVLVLVIF